MCADDLLVTCTAVLLFRAGQKIENNNSDSSLAVPSVWTPCPAGRLGSNDNKDARCRYRYQYISYFERYIAYHDKAL